jgi:hypothetical protein
MGGPTETSTAPGREEATATATATATPPEQGGALGRLRPPSAPGEARTPWAGLSERERPARALAISPTPRPGHRSQHGAPVPSRPGRSHRARTSHIAFVGPSQRSSVHVIHGPVATSHKGVNRQPRRPPSRPALRLSRVCWAASATPPPSRGNQVHRPAAVLLVGVPSLTVGVQLPYRQCRCDLVHDLERLALAQHRG